MKGSYAKLKDGSWGVKVVCNAPEDEARVSEGLKIAVATRKGATKTEIVDKVLWKGVDQDGSVALLARVKGGRLSEDSAFRQRARGSTLMCPGCGRRLNLWASCSGEKDLVNSNQAVEVVG